jgi:WD repeat-containing protein 24
VTLLIIMSPYVRINENLQEQWLFSYIELLRRLELYELATEIARHSRSSLLGEHNQVRKITNFHRLAIIDSIVSQSSTIYTSCPNCFGPLELSLKGYWTCDRCRQVISICSLCHQTIRGLYACCRVCGHGGHLNHWNTWFSIHDLCPTGCGHSCSTHFC